MDFPKVEVAAGAGNSEAIVLGFFQSEEKGKSRSELPVFNGKRDKDLESLLEKLSKSKHFSAKRGETDVLRFVGFASYPAVMLVGMGSQEKCTLETLRRTGASVFQAQKKSAFERLALQGESFFSSCAEGESEALQAFIEGYLLASYQYTEFKKVEKASEKKWSLSISGVKGPAAKQAIDKAFVLAEAVCFARHLGDKPGNLLTPTELADLVEKMAKSRKLKCTVFNRARIEKEKMGLLMGVAKGSVEDPREIGRAHV